MRPPVKIGTVACTPTVQFWRASDSCGKISVGKPEAPEARDERDARQALRARDLDLRLLGLERLSELPPGRARVHRGVGERRAGRVHVGRGRLARRADAGGGDRGVRELQPERVGRVVDPRDEVEAVVDGHADELLEAQIRDVARGERLDQRRPLVVARDLRADQLELGLIAHLAGEARLGQDELRLLERLARDRDELVGEHGVEVGAGHVQRGLRALGADVDFRGAHLRARCAHLGANPAAGEQVSARGRARPTTRCSRRSPSG
jgi:hypothetical protein